LFLPSAFNNKLALAHGDDNNNWVGQGLLMVTKKGRERGREGCEK